MTSIHPEAELDLRSPDVASQEARRELVDGKRLRFFQYMRAFTGRVLSVFEWLFGLVSLVLGLAILAPIPIIQFLSLGYLLEASGRAAESGRIRDFFVGIRKSARVGSILLGTWLVLLPVRLAVDLARDASIIDPGGETASRWRIGSLVLFTIAVIHIAWAWYRGGRLRSFLWPAPLRFVRQIRQGGWFNDAQERFFRFLGSLRCWHYWWLGFRGFLGTTLWLVVPVSLMVMATRLSDGPSLLVTLLGAALLCVAVAYLPFQQTEFGRTRQLRSFFSLRTARDGFRRAPIFYWVALLTTLLFALPLYLLKAELIPREATWLPSIVFVAFALPARLITGWAVGIARRREKPRHALFRWPARFAIVPVVTLYVLIVYITRYTSWYGSYSLFEQHAFLLPVPFFGL